jgi:hypothetical protein
MHALSPPPAEVSLNLRASRADGFKPQPGVDSCMIGSRAPGRRFDQSRGPQAVTEAFRYPGFLAQSGEEGLEGLEVTGQPLERVSTLFAQDFGFAYYYSAPQAMQ